MVYIGEYITGLDKDLNSVVKCGSIDKDELMEGNGFPLPFIRKAMYTGTMMGSFHKVWPKKYQASAELKNLWLVTKNKSFVVFINDWDSWKLGM